MKQEAGNMQRYIGLLRAVNVGGTGKLPMAELRAMGEAVGFAAVQTYIASGNLVFSTDMEAWAARRVLEAELERYAGKPVPVFLRSGAEMAAVLAQNPFGASAGNRVMAVFLEEAPPVDALSGVSGLADEEISLGAQEIYIHCPSGQGRSRLRIPAAEVGTARNMNTVARLAEMASG